jgi:hypothetical protein
MRPSLLLRSAAVGKSSPAEYNVNLVRSSDYTSFLPAFFYPVHLRDSYIALRAFNVELASIKESVSNETLGRLRTTWWRESIGQVYKVKHSFFSPNMFVERFFSIRAMTGSIDQASSSIGSQESHFPSETL